MIDDKVISIYIVLKRIISIMLIQVKVLFDLYRETHKDKYKLAMDLLVKQMKKITHIPLKVHIGINSFTNIKYG